MLADRLKHGALPLERALSYGVEIAEALHEAHRQGIVHRDLKPGNIILVRQGIKLMDFGLAKIVRPVTTTDAATATSAAELRRTATGSLIGTVPYMAPSSSKAGPPIAAPTSSPWAACWTRWSPVDGRSRGEPSRSDLSDHDR